MERLPQEYSTRDGICRGAQPVRATVDVGGFRPEEAANDNRMSKLARTIEHEIIPRLMLAHRVSLQPMLDAAVAELPITRDDVEQFSKLVLSQDEDAAFASIQTLRERGLSAEKVYADLLAPTARYLGDLWDQDLCSFTDVTVGLGRLQRVLREMSSELGRGVDHPVDGRRVLLLPSPGEQHTFGLMMVAEIFRSAGWDVTGGAWVTTADAAALVTAEWFDVVGFSLGSQNHVSALAETIAMVRHVACNPRITILVGGPLIGMHPELMTALGADGMTADGREGPALAERLIDARVRQSGAGV